MKIVKHHPVPKSASTTGKPKTKFVVLYWSHDTETENSSTFDSLQECLENRETDETILSIVEIQA